MDPNAAWEIVASNPPQEDIAFQALDLLAWLANGGFPPAGFMTGEVVEACQEEIIKALETGKGT